MEKGRFKSTRAKKSYGNINIDYVLSRMPHPNMIEIKKGYFLETATGLDDDFSFVNLDMDLYKPTLDGLRFFFAALEGWRGCFGS